jgi:RNase adaptor protein for sRNA GlmZ degradation
VIDGIQRETELLEPIRERADSVIDTTGLSASMLRRKVANELLEREAPGRMAVTFTSFGHKHGPPRDADLAYDVRFLPNPRYEAELRPPRASTRGSSSRSGATGAWESSASAWCRCSSTCSGSTWPRGRHTS